MNIVLVTFYDQICTGARSIAASLVARGHDVAFLHVKRTQTEFIPRTEEAIRPELQQGYQLFFDIKPEGNYYFPFPTIATETEKELFVDWIVQRGAEIVAFSLLTIFSPLAQELSRRLRARAPKVKIIWGGVHCWFTPEESIQYADAVCVGEGEHPMIDYAADPSRTDIANLWFNVDGQIVRNPPRELYQDLDELPFSLFGHNEYLLEGDKIEEVPLDDAHREYYENTYYISTQRGCPYQCSYCSHSQMRVIYRGQKYIRRRGHEHVFAELDIQTKRLDLKTIKFLDDVFLLDPRWVRRFCEEYPSRVGLPFGCYVYPTGGVEEMLEMAVKAGLGYVNAGIQSGSPYIMTEIFGRKYDMEKTARMCRKADELGVLLVYDVLCFNPFEDESHMRETLEFLLRLPNAHEMHTFRLNLFPGIRMLQLDKPRHEETPDRIRLLYALLYQATRHPDLKPETIRAMAENPVYRENPESLAEILAVMLRDHLNIWALNEEKKGLRKQLEAQAAGARGDGRWLDHLRAKTDWLLRVKTHKPRNSPMPIARVSHS
ncbi:MAG: cobalamin-dependent protein [Candidatus Sumerlaeota bacterium]|nr:cobalamin-dependent protein [Candidatus Sumerlaeota bacterium]